MAKVVVTMKIMPEGTETNLEELKEKVEKEIKEFNGNLDIKIEEEPIGFGLTALKFLFVMEEEKGSTDPLEEKLKNIEGIGNAEVTDVRRTIG